MSALVNSVNRYLEYKDWTDVPLYNSKEKRTDDNLLARKATRKIDVPNSQSLVIGQMAPAPQGPGQMAPQPQGPGPLEPYNEYGDRDEGYEDLQQLNEELAE